MCSRMNSKGVNKIHVGEEITRNEDINQFGIMGIVTLRDRAKQSIIEWEIGQNVSY